MVAGPEAGGRRDRCMTVYYHGSRQPNFSGWRPDGGSSDDQDMLFLSRSANVASRYGQVYALCLPSLPLPTISVDDWFNMVGPAGSGSFLITGNGGYDFPVDTLVLREPPAGEFRPVPKQELIELDDGLARSHDPVSANDRQFDAYISEHYDGDYARFEFEASAVNHVSDCYK